MIFRIARAVMYGSRSSRGPAGKRAGNGGCLAYPLGYITVPLLIGWPLIAFRHHSPGTATAAWLGLLFLLAVLAWIARSPRRRAASRGPGGPYSVTWAMTDRKGRNATAGALVTGCATRGAAREAARRDALRPLSWVSDAGTDIAMVRCLNGSVVAYRVRKVDSQP